MSSVVVSPAALSLIPASGELPTRGTAWLRLALSSRVYLPAFSIVAVAASSSRSVGRVVGVVQVSPHR